MTQHKRRLRATPSKSAHGLQMTEGKGAKKKRRHKAPKAWVPDPPQVPIAEDEDSEGSLISSSDESSTHSVDSYAESLLIRGSTYASMESQLLFYMKKYHETKEKCRIQESQRRQLESLGKSPQDSQEILQQQSRRITIQKMQLDNKADLEPYFFFEDVPNAVPDSHRLLELFQALQNELATLLLPGDAKEYLVQTLPDKCDDLDSLWSTVFGRGTPFKLEPTPGVLLTSISYELLQSLIGASIYGWVFGEEVRTQSSLRITPLMDKYHRVIYTLGGPERLSSLGLAAYRSLAESNDFERNIVPDTSGSFTTRLVEALVPFFHENMRSEMAERLQTLLSAMFELALQAVSELMPSDERLELIWPKPGSEANKAEMQSVDATPIADGKVVRLPILPGLRERRGQKTDADVYGSAECSCTDRSGVVIVKAVVLC